jgi:hypothetical protein
VTPVTRNAQNREVKQRQKENQRSREAGGKRREWKEWVTGSTLEGFVLSTIELFIIKWLLFYANISFKNMEDTWRICR